MNFILFYKKLNGIRQKKKKLAYLKNGKFQLGLFFLSVVVLSFFNFWRVLTFGFLRDDWGFLWATQYDPGLQLAWVLHPGTRFEDFLLFPLFKWNVFYWQLFGIVLRIFASLSIAAMLWGFFRSKKIAVLGGLFFSVSIIGLETVSWASVHVVAVDIFFTCVGYYFLSEYFRQKKHLFILLSLLFFVSATISDPARVFPIIMLSSIFSAQFIISEKTTNNYKNRLIFFLFFYLILLGVFYISSVHDKDIVKRVLTGLPDPNNLKTIFASLGNVFFGWFVNIHEIGSLATFNPFTAQISFILLFNTLLFSLYLTITKKSKWTFMILFFVLWIFAAYLPNWIFEKGLVVGGTHRYVGLSGVGFICILAIGVGNLGKKSLLLLCAAFIVLNIVTSQRILGIESTYRQKSIGETLWNKIIHDVAPNERNNIFIYLGSDYTRGSLLDFSGSVPFAVANKIQNINDFPVATANDNLIIALLCKKGTMRPGVPVWIPQPELIPLSHVHAWDVTNGKITNVSNREQVRLQQKAAAEGCIVQL